jgi:membrane-associated protease RseP (regulator of RpoE activity)
MENIIASEPITLDDVGRLRQAIADMYTIDKMEMNQPKRGMVRFWGKPLCDLTICFPELRQRFEAHGYTPVLRGDVDQQVLVGVPFVIDPAQTRWQINALLFVATIFSTLYVGASNETGFTGYEIWLGIPFSFSLLLILGAHELGHYFASRYHKVKASLPYFIPFPSLFGTLGAVILQREPATNRRVLLDIGAAGPLAGLVFAIPIVIIGLWTSEVAPLPVETGYALEGNSLLYAGIKYLVFGEFLPSNGMDVLVNQVAWAGWVGLLVTGLNLLPVAQLDGGHMAYVLFGKYAKSFFLPALALFVGLGFALTGTLQYALFAALIIFMGNNHAVPFDDVTPLNPLRKTIAIFCLILFILTFVPVPLTFVPPV